MPIDAVVVSGFIQKNIYDSIVSSSRNLTDLASFLSLENCKIQCLLEPTDLGISEQFFSLTLYQPFFNRPFNPARLEMINVGNVQILAIPDQLVPGVPGINQDMFDLKVRLGDRQMKGKTRIFFSGLPPDEWQERPYLLDPTSKHLPFFLHGTNSAVEKRDDHFSVGADGLHFNIVEIDDLDVSVQQFKKEGLSFQWVHNSNIPLRNVQGKS